ncbi:MAG: ATP-binding cassette domain-containing protein, partial [Mesorhizobium sp.]
AITGKAEAELKPARRDMQVVFQDPYGSFDPRQKVEKLVAEPLHLLQKQPTQAERREMVAHALHEVGLGPRDMDKYPHEFSGGQRQRLSIARAIITRPKLVVADEPVSALDLSVQAQVLNLLADLQDEFQLTYVFISHDLSVVRYIADDVMVMYFGEAVEYGPRDEVFSNPKHAYTKTLFAATPRADVASIKARLAKKAA